VDRGVRRDRGPNAGRRRRGLSPACPRRSSDTGASGGAHARDASRVRRFL
jgi:hypothetical protein